MILVDMNQVMISNLMVQIGSHTNIELEEDLLRHMILNKIRLLNKKFGNEYGQIIICCDDKNYWRKRQFSYYKLNRKKSREQSDLDWSMIFNTLNKVRDEVKEFLPYKVVHIETAEADDIIGTLTYAAVNPMHYQTKYDVNLAELRGEKVLILSGDKDFIQLHRFPNVKQFDPTRKKWIKHTSPTRYLIEHIAKGDRGDGIPNFISRDDCFANGIRQRPLRAKYLEQLKGSADQIEKDLSDEEKRGWIRNKMLIDLEFVPTNIQQLVLTSFNQPTPGRDKLFNYFVKYKLKNLMENISEF